MQFFGYHFVHADLLIVVFSFKLTLRTVAEWLHGVNSVTLALVEDEEVVVVP